MDARDPNLTYVLNMFNILSFVVFVVRVAKLDKDGKMQKQEGRVDTLWFFFSWNIYLFFFCKNLVGCISFPYWAVICRGINGNRNVDLTAAHDLTLPTCICSRVVNHGGDRFERDPKPESMDMETWVTRRDARCRDVSIHDSLSHFDYLWRFRGTMRWTWRWRWMSASVWVLTNERGLDYTASFPLRCKHQYGLH